jgi:hypothetical protein
VTEGPSVFAPPNANLDTPAEYDATKIEQVRVGQRWLVGAILLTLSFLPALALLGPGGGTTLALSLMVASSLLAICGMWRVSRGLGSGTVASIVLLCLLMSVPVISLIVMIAVYLQARRALRQAGYTVGLLGAKAK